MEFKLKHKSLSISWNSRNKERVLWLTGKNRAKRLNIPFDLSIEDIHIPSMCPYLQIPITSIYGEGRKQSNASLDRIDSSKGYVKGNIQIISDLANRMKQDATVEQLLVFARGVLNTHAS